LAKLKPAKGVKSYSNAHTGKGSSASLSKSRPIRARNQPKGQSISDRVKFSHRGKLYATGRPTKQAVGRVRTPVDGRVVNILGFKTKSDIGR